MVNYTIAEYCDIHFFYGAALGNAVQARRLYHQQFPDRQLPNSKTFSSVHNRLRETGKFQVCMADTGRGKTVRTVDFEEDVLQRFEDNPSTSTRAVGNTLEVSRSTVWRVLHGENMHAFHLQKVHALEPRDFPRRLACSQWFIHKLADNPHFLKQILFTDEASFTREGMFNSKNSHVWDQVNPHETVIRGHQQRFSVNVWAGVLGDSLVGPYVLPDRLNSPTYLVFIRDVLPELLEDVALQDRLHFTWFQHDGAPAHFGVQVRDHLNTTFGENWIGRGGPSPWPARSPDLTPLDFYVWGYMKSLVYSTPVANEMDLIGRIVEAAAIIQEKNHFGAVRQSLSNRFVLCNQMGGGNFEHCL
jgi:hypothetical protein